MKINHNKYIDNFIFKTKNKSFYDKFNRNIPIIETAFSGVCYCGAIALNNNLDKKRKPALYWQTILGCLFGMTASKAIDNSINGLRNKICENVSKVNIPKVNKVVSGLRIAIPLVTTATITRIAVPVALVPLSTKIEEIRKGKINANR